MENDKDKDKDYFNVEVFGDYFVAGTEGNVIRSFGYVTLRMRVWDNCQNLARFHIIPNLLREADPDFQNIRKCVVVKVRTSDNKPVYNIPLAFMSREDIAMEVKTNHIPLRADMCNDIVELRKKLRFARSNPQEFAKQEAKRTKSYSKIDDAMILNKDVFAKIKEKNMDFMSGRINDAATADDDNKNKLADLPMPASGRNNTVRLLSNHRPFVEAAQKDLPEVQVENPNENIEDNEKDVFNL